MGAQDTVCIIDTPILQISWCYDLPGQYNQCITYKNQIKKRHPGRFTVNTFSVKTTWMAIAMTYKSRSHFHRKQSLAYSERLRVPKKPNMPIPDISSMIADGNGTAVTGVERLLPSAVVI